LQSRRWGGGAGAGAAGESAGAAQVIHHGPPLCLQAAHPCPWFVTDYALSYASSVLKDFHFS